MHDYEQVKAIAIITAGTCGLAFIIYNFILSCRESDSYLQLEETNIKEFDNEDDSRATLKDYLSCVDEECIETPRLSRSLSKLIDCSAFTKVQVLIKDLGYLGKIMNLLNHPDYTIKQKAALLINNLSLNAENQDLLKDAIPILIQTIKLNVINPTTVTLFVAVLQALTNLTTLDDSHDTLLPHIAILCELLLSCDVIQIKLQVLKILVNVSTNSKLCENKLELDAQLLRSVETYTSPRSDDAFILRAVACCANVLTSLHRRWEHDGTIATPEFVNEKLRSNFIELTSHHMKDIQMHAQRCLVALRPPTNDHVAKSQSLENIDMLEMLKL